MSKRPTIVADLVGGETVRIAAGVVRIMHRSLLGCRWAMLLGDDGREVKRGEIWLNPTDKVFEVLS